MYISICIYIYISRSPGRAEQLLARCGHADDDRGVRAFRALVRARLCGVYALRPRWHSLVDQLTEESRTLMERLS